MNRTDLRRAATVAWPLAVAAVFAACSGTTKSAASQLPDAVGPATSPPVGNAPSPRQASPSSWLEAQEGSGHSSSTSALGPTRGAPLWRADLRDPLIDGPVVSSSGVVYQSTAAGDLVALSLRTGSQLWTFAGGAPFADADLSISPAVLATGTILWPAPNNRLDAISPTGRLLWSTPFSGRVLSPTVTSTGVAYVTDGNGTLEALRPTDRNPGMLWSLKVGAVSYSSPAVAPDGTVYAAADNHLEAITDRSGRPIRAWQFTAGGAIEVSPSVGPDGTVILGTNDRYEYGLSPNGQDKWRYLRQVYSYSSPAVTADGLAYFGDNSGGVAVVRDDTGMVVGRYSTATRPLSANGVGVWTAPAVDGRHDVYFGTASGHIFGFGFTGRPLFDLDTGAPVTAYPAIAPDGTLIIGSANGTLYAFKN